MGWFARVWFRKQRSPVMRGVAHLQQSTPLSAFPRDFFPGGWRDEPWPGVKAVMSVCANFTHGRTEENISIERFLSIR